MIRNGTVLMVILAGLAAGCNLPKPGTSRVLGDVSYASAFATAREVMSQHFSISTADAEAGVIEARPKLVEAPAERLLGSSPARQVASLQLRRENGLIVAHASVALQREGSSVHRVSARPGENYDDVPNRTPAEDVAATTPRQNEIWRTERQDRALERRILDQIYKALHPQAK